MTERDAFEAWAKQPPMEWDCERYTENEAWPNNYRHYPAQCAWEGWQARAQTAQVVPLLDVVELMRAVLDADQNTTHTRGTTNWAAAIGRAVEQAVRAKLGVAVPMPPEDWSVFNTGAEVASGLTWAEAWNYMTPSRIERGWTAVCVANKSNIGIVGKEGV